MGYHSTLEPFCLQFQNEEKIEEFKKLSKEEKEIGMNPIYHNLYTDTEFTDEIYFKENVVKTGKHQEWIPFFAKYLKGTIYIDGEETYDLWKIVFIGDGTFKTYRGVIEYEEVERI